MPLKKKPTVKAMRQPLDNSTQVGDWRVTVRIPEMAKPLQQVKERKITIIKAGKNP